MVLREESDFWFVGESGVVEPGPGGVDVGEVGADYIIFIVLPKTVFGKWWGREEVGLSKGNV